MLEATGALRAVVRDLAERTLRGSGGCGVTRIDERTAHRIGRLGYLTYGVVQLVIAALVLQVAWGRSGAEASTSGAIQTLAGQPLGLVLVWVVAVGIALLAAW